MYGHDMWVARCVLQDMNHDDIEHQTLTLRWSSILKTTIFATKTKKRVAHVIR